MDGAGQCDIDEKGKRDANALSIANVGGVFLVLAVGLLLSVIVAVVEFVWNERKRAAPVNASKVDCLFWFQLTINILVTYPFRPLPFFPFSFLPLSLSFLASKELLKSS